MKPDWDKLMKEYEGSSTVLIADVDCTAGGKELCNSVGVRGYPTIKSGDPNDLQDYKGGRSFNDLKKHAETLGPTCGPANLDLCDAEKKAKIEEFMALSAEKRDEMIKEKEAASEKLESDFKAYVEGLNKQYKAESEKKDSAIEAIKNSGLGLLKSVHKYEGKKAKGEL
mmetsp:Transcript_105277/g.285913  ORF Transcript_105277/g.285913 Transcript_105277/m.285913 type:complete len:169 (-) Transcript_105277:293-799(-)